jgi:hypothetical protein
VLNDFFYATGGPSWIINYGWLDPFIDFCTWWGVKCNTADGSSFRLSLVGNRLEGYIPDSIGQFGKSITSLLIDENNLKGTIPNSCTNLTELTQYDVSQNLLTGTVPEGFGNLTKLQLYWISDNLLTGYLPLDLAPILAKVVEYQSDQGCRTAGNLFCCPVPEWSPVECGMGCSNNMTCEVSVPSTSNNIKLVV